MRPSACSRTNASFTAADRLSSMVKAWRLETMEFRHNAFQKHSDPPGWGGAGARLTRRMPQLWCHLPAAGWCGGDAAARGIPVATTGGGRMRAVTLWSCLGADDAPGPQETERAPRHAGRKGKQAPEGKQAPKARMLRPGSAHLAVPVHTGSQAAQLVADAVSVLAHPLPHLLQEALAACRAAHTGAAQV